MSIKWPLGRIEVSGRAGHYTREPSTSHDEEGATCINRMRISWIHTYRLAHWRTAALQREDCFRSAWLRHSFHRTIQVGDKSIWRNHRLKLDGMRPLVAVVHDLLVLRGSANRTDSPIKVTPHIERHARFIPWRLHIRENRSTKNIAMVL